jgi:phage tail-like protein
MPEAAAQPGTWVDPFRDYNFKLLVNNITSAHFIEVYGLGVSVELLSYREHGNNSIVRAVPGRVTYPPVTLKTGLTSSVELWDWLMSAVKGQVIRRNVSIVVLDAAGATEVLRWNLLNAWLQEWHCPPLNAMSRGLAIEKMVLAHEGLELEPGGAATQSA